MRVLVAPDSFGGTLTPVQAAAAIATGWRAARPRDEVVTLPLSDGGEGLLDALLAGGAVTDAAVHELDVAGPRGIVTSARWALGVDGVAVVETAEACGLRLLAEDRRDPRLTTTWGVGQLLGAVHAAGARRVVVGLGGSATVDGGTGALSGLGFRLTVADGSGLKIGGEDLPRVRGAARTWTADWDGVAVELLADVTTTLHDAPAVFGPQKGADAATVAHLEDGLRAWATVAERDLGAPTSLADAAGTGAAGGLAYGLAVGLAARIRPGAAAVAELVGLDAAIASSDLVVVGEGRLDATSTTGKVLGEVVARATTAGVPVVAVVGAVGDRDVLDGLDDVVAAAPDGAGADPATEVTAAAHALAGRR